MDNLNRYLKLAVFILIAVAIIPVSANAAVKYKFIVTAGPSTTSHTPFEAELELSDSAVDAGQAIASDVESLRIVGGNYVPAADPINFSDLHAHFINLAAILSGNKETIDSFSAQSSQNMQQFDYWVFYQQNPNTTDPNVHDNEVLVSATSVIFRTLLLPNYNYAISEFTGEWRKQNGENGCRICKIIDQYVAGCFPWCPWPWILISSVIIVIITARLINKRRQK